MFTPKKSHNQLITTFPFTKNNYSLFLKREDTLHPFVSGNKYRKLTYNIQHALHKDYKTLLTFGGAYSNHIAAVAAAGKEVGLQTVGVIRGEELENNYADNPTLQFARSCGMKLHFISRETYRKKDVAEVMEALSNRFGRFYGIPEGGSNALAVRGCEEILEEEDAVFDYICVSVGTGSTMAGLIKASKPHQQVIGFSALKGTFQTSEIEKYTFRKNYTLLDSYCFNGYAKIDMDLVRFINNFKAETHISLDPVYTGKMMYGIMDLIKKGYFKENSRILAIHTGGLQGIEGMNIKLKNKNLPQIIV